MSVIQFPLQRRKQLKIPGRCTICGRAGADDVHETGGVHMRCARCPKCDSDWVIAKRPLKPAAALRCLDCLHRWTPEENR